MNRLRKFLYYFKTPFVRRTSRTVRFAFPVVMLSGVLLLANTISSLQQPEIILEISDTQVMAGESAYLDVKIDTRTEINAATIIIQLPSEAVLIDTIETSNSVITLWTEKPRVENNQIILRGGTFRRGFVGEHTIARVVFTPTTSGSFSFRATDIELVAGDGQGTVITPDASSVQSKTLYAFLPGEKVPTNTLSPSTIEAIRTQFGIDKDTVGLREISQFMSAWTTGSRSYDFNGDNRMTFTDFGILLTYTIGL